MPAFRYAPRCTQVARGDEELRLLREELERWKEKAETEEALRIAAEAARDALQEENRRLQEQQQQDSQALSEVEEARDRLAAKKAELERELEELEEQMDEQIEGNQKLLGEKKTLMTQMEDLKADLVGEGGPVGPGVCGGTHGLSISHHTILEFCL